jgi:hypothetical protein
MTDAVKELIEAAEGVLNFLSARRGRIPAGPVELNVRRKIAAAKREQESPKVDNYVAWICLRHRADNGETYLKLCDSDEPGAFKVYRGQTASAEIHQPPPITQTHPDYEEGN